MSYRWVLRATERYYLFKAYYVCFSPKMQSRVRAGKRQPICTAWCKKYVNKSSWMYLYLMFQILKNQSRKERCQMQEQSSKQRGEARCAAVPLASSTQCSTERSLFTSRNHRLLEVWRDLWVHLAQPFLKQQHPELRAQDHGQSKEETPQSVWATCASAVTCTVK